MTDTRRIDPETVEVKCTRCGGTERIALDLDQEARWRAGALIQNVLPWSPAAEREFLISGLCPDCWDAVVTTADADDDVPF